MTDSSLSGSLDGQVTAMDVVDPTEGNEKTSLLEVDDEFDVQLSWQLTGSSTPVVGAPGSSRCTATTWTVSAG